MITSDIKWNRRQSKMENAHSHTKQAIYWIRRTVFMMIMSCYICTMQILCMSALCHVSSHLQYSHLVCGSYKMPISQLQSSRKKKKTLSPNIWTAKYYAMAQLFRPMQYTKIENRKINKASARSAGKENIARARTFIDTTTTKTNLHFLFAHSYAAHFCHSIQINIYV